MLLAFFQPSGCSKISASFRFRPTARQITFKKGKNVGIRLTGGNDVGIFVASVQDNSPAAKQGLKMGDQILSVNDFNFRNIIREEAILTLMGLPTGSSVKIVAQAQPEGTCAGLSTSDNFRSQRSLA